MTWKKSEKGSNIHGGKMVEYCIFIDNEEVKFSFSIFPCDVIYSSLHTNNQMIENDIKVNWCQLGIIKAIDRGYTPTNVINTNNKDIITKFILGIHSRCPFNKETRSEIFQELKLIDIEAWNKKIKQFVDEGKFQEILADILPLEFDELLLILTQYCESRGELHNALACYQSFSEDSRHYKLANNRASEILMGLIDKHKDGSISLTEEELRQYKEYLVRFSLRNIDTQLTDHYYHELSGGGLTLPTITSVKLDEDTLIKIGYQTRDLRSEIAQLKNELAGLNSKLNNNNNNDKKEKKTTEPTIATKKFPGFHHQNSRQAVNGNEGVSLLPAERRNSI